jgi:hypothetical protein
MNLNAHNLKISTLGSIKWARLNLGCILVRLLRLINTRKYLFGSGNGDVDTF